ncbi:MAG: TQO small subunit DoxD [Ktedonobacteraceae bacterium]
MLTRSTEASNTSPMKTPFFQVHPLRLTRWVLLPLRLFLGITFIYAGLQKLTDPQFFDPTARGYIGKQIIGFASGSPLHNLLIHVAVPHAHIFGLLIAFGEIAIGIGTILGLLFRPAAFFGLLLSLTFFLTATWRVFPYFYGADIVFVFCWLTLLIASPSNTGLPALDDLFVRRYLSHQQRKRFAPLLAFFLGVDQEAPTPVSSTDNAQTQTRPLPSNKRPTQQQSRYALALQHERESRRNFIVGTLTGAGGMFVLAWLWNTLHLFPGTADTSTSTGTSTTPANGTPVTAGSGTPIAQVNAVQNNSSVNFTIASNNDPGILVRLNNGQFVAYDAICTHAGCPVDYDPSSQMLVCPCHGAAFDPSKNAAVVQGPASTPLTSVPVHVDSATGSITVN